MDCLISLYFIFFIDVSGFAIIYVFLAPLILNPESNMLSHSISAESRNMILVMLFAACSISQFFSAPVFGELSDGTWQKVNIMNLWNSFSYRNRPDLKLGKIRL